MTGNKKRSGKNIVLAGFMATGKSAVGRRLAKRLGRRFVDTDRLVEKETGLKVREIFERRGEDYFRDRESEVVASLEKYTPGSLVVAAGGGALNREANRKMLKKHGLLILLTADPQTIIKRASLSPGKRPLLETADPEARIKTMLEERKQAYSACDTSIDTTGRDIESIVDEIIKYLEDR